MSDEIQISQAASLASGNTQIGVQNNYNGISVEKATRVLMDVFLDNFPRLQQIAMETAKARAEEICQKTMQKLADIGIHDLSPFSDPDVQYVFLNAQIDYARQGTEELLSILSSLLATRVAHNDEHYIKLVIDRSLSVAPYLNQQQLDYLSLLFYCKRFVSVSVNSIEELNNLLNKLDRLFSPCNPSGISLLNSLGCFELCIGYPYTFLANLYHLPEEQIKQHCPPKIASLAPDYGPSHIGIVLATSNIELRCKNEFRFDLKEWIKC